MSPNASNSDDTTISLSALDELYKKLKEHDPQWLIDVFQKRWLDIGTSTAETDHGAKQDRSQTWNEESARPKGSDRDRLWPYDLTHSTWTTIPDTSEHHKFVHEYDWATSSLGPMSSWSAELRYIVNLTMTDPRPAAIWWGEDRTVIYNKAYADILGARHPAAMGKPFAQVWPEMIPDFAPIFVKGTTQGLASLGDNALFMTNRNNFREELWASWNVIPVPAEGDGVGFFNPVVETTRQALTDRRLSTLLTIGQSLATATDTPDFWQRLMRGLQLHEYDVPFAALYIAQSIESQKDNHSSEPFETGSAKSSDGSTTGQLNKTWTLHDTIGLPVTNTGLPVHLETQSTTPEFIPDFAELLAVGRPTLLSTQSGSYPQSLHPIARSKIFDEPCDSLVFCPIATTHREKVLGFILLGVNPCHEYDKDYDQFVQLLVRQVSTSLASLVLTEDERKRAEQDRVRLSAQLAATQHIAVEHEKRFRSMADLAPVAMFHVGADGTMLYANDVWFELTEHPRDGLGPMSWIKVVHEDDHPILNEMWTQLGLGDPVQFEIRLRKKFVTNDTMNGVQVEGDTWIIAAAYTEKNEDGTVRGMLGCLTDISKQKWAEGLQARRVEEAMELRRQQENFMDMTSHEARNPLSAMTLCAESMITTFRDIVDADLDPVNMSLDTVRTHLEGAEVIMICAQHQKRIIDDVLTLSKVDSGLLIIAPIEVRPQEIVEQALKMLESEFDRGDIAVDLVVTEQYKSLGVDWVRLDPSRILQVLINLLTNAVKFTRTRDHRHIKVTLDASLERPHSQPDGIKYLGQLPARSYLTPEGKDDVYLSVTVNDTGTGIPVDELSQLFQRFQQANPKTHVEYGGSGLGLFVCRELVKLQGGDIGVTSEASKGSSFAFFVRTTRCPPPAAERKPLVTNHVLRGSNGTVAQPSGSADGSVAQRAANVMTARSGWHVLLVEDNLVNQRVMSTQLGRAGFTVTVAHHGGEALEAIRASRFCDLGSGNPLDIVLLDVEMPIMDGLTCVKKIRDMERDGSVVAHVPIIAVTANARAEQQAIALASGMDSVITKPFRMVDLMPEIERVRNMHATT